MTTQLTNDDLDRVLEEHNLQGRITYDSSIPRIIQEFDLTRGTKTADYLAGAILDALSDPEIRLAEDDQVHLTASNIHQGTDYNAGLWECGGIDIWGEILGVMTPPYIAPVDVFNLLTENTRIANTRHNARIGVGDLNLPEEMRTGRYDQENAVFPFCSEVTPELMQAVVDDFLGFLNLADEQYGLSSEHGPELVIGEIDGGKVSPRGYHFFRKPDQLHIHAVDHPSYPLAAYVNTASRCLKPLDHSPSIK